MKRTLCLIWRISTLVYSGQLNDVKRGKVYSSTQEYINLSPLIGGRILEDGSDVGIDLRPQGVAKYYDKPLSKGISIQTSINDHLQTDVASEIEWKTMELRAEDAFVGVMNNHTGEIVMLTRSSMDYPPNIRTKAIPVLKDKFSDYLFDPTSLMLPIWGTIMAEKKDAKEFVEQIDKTIDDMSDIASFLSVEEIIAGLNAFGFGKPSGIDLPYDEVGRIPSKNELQYVSYRLALLAGHGIQVTFMQMLKAYSAFSTEGLLLTPHIASKTIEGNVTKKISFPVSRAFSKELSKNVKYALINKVKCRSDILMIDQIDIGGAFGTNDLYADGNVTEKAYSAYFGFAENTLQGQSYTIGVFLIYKKSKRTQKIPSPMPIFNLVVEEMVKEKLLKVKKEHFSEGAMSPMPTGEITEYFSEQVERVPECLENTKRGISLDCQYITYRAPEDGAFVHTVLDGKVTFVGSHKKYGKVVIVRHENKLDTMYANLDYVKPTIKEGVALKKGYGVGRVKETLIFQLIKDGERVDPVDFLSGEI